MTLLDTLHSSAMQREAQHLQRTRRVHAHRDGVWAQVDQQRLLNFSSNDYLGFTQHPKIIEAFQHAAHRFGVGSAGSALVSGYFSSHHGLEEQAAALFGYQACLYVSSGYLANLGVLQSLLNAESTCVQDKLNHACLLDGARFSGARLLRYPHGNMAVAAQRCRAACSSNTFLVSDGVFSMDGDAAPLTALAEIAENTSSTLMIDDAHGVGVLGETGLGSLQAAGLQAQAVPILIVPAGKALGGQGALVLSSTAIISHLINTARPYLFSTAPAPAMAAALSQALCCLQHEPEHHARLQANIQYFTQLAAQAQLPLLPSSSAIQPVVIGANAGTVALADRLQQQGFWLSAVRPPTVPVGKARLRITLSAQHRAEHIEALVEALHTQLKALSAHAY